MSVSHGGRVICRPLLLAGVSNSKGAKMAPVHPVQRQKRSCSLLSVEEEFGQASAREGNVNWANLEEAHHLLGGSRPQM